MHHHSERADSSDYRRWALFAGLLCISAVACIAAELDAASRVTLSGYVLPFALLVTALFNAAFSLARWLLTKDGRRTFLFGRLPFAIGLSKLAAMATMVLLALALLAGIVLGAPFRAIALRALAFGIVWSCALLMAANGLLNAIILVRHFRGTLSDTSRVRLK